MKHCTGRLPVPMGKHIMSDFESYRVRRLELMRRMGSGAALIPTAPEVVRNRDSHYPYRFDSYFYYLTGFREPEAVLLLIAGEQPRSILFCRDKDLEREIWDGFRYGPAAAQAEFGFDEAYSITQLDDLVPELLADQPRLYYSVGHDAGWDARVTAWLNQVRERGRSGIAAPEEIVNVRFLLDEMRLYKSEVELEVMRRAAQISADAHAQAMRITRPGLMEYEIEAELLHAFYRHGSQAPAYTSIVAGGANACVLHYIANNAQLKDGDLLLIDAGCELDGYASDITRTFPVNGRSDAGCCAVQGTGAGSAVCRNRRDPARSSLERAARSGVGGIGAGLHRLRLVPRQRRGRA